MASTVFPAASSAVASGSQTFTSSSTWTAPTGVTAVNYIVAAGGGGGGSGINATSNGNYNFCSGGGAGGEVTRGTLSVTPGTSYTVTVGAGGDAALISGTGTSAVIGAFAAAGGYSAFAPSFTLKNAITNGAMELSTNDGWLAGYSGTAGFPFYDSAYPAAYNGQPMYNNNMSYNGSRTGGTNIPGVTNSAGVVRTIVSTQNQAYNDVQKFINVTPSTAYVLSGYTSVDNNGTGSQVAIAIDYYTSPNAVGRISGDATSFTTVSTSSSVWTRITLNTTSPAGALYAVVRFANNNNSNSAQMRWTGMQLEAGSSVTDYVGINTAGYKTLSGFGIVSISSGVMASGGGGGWSTLTGASRPGIGFGGGKDNTNVNSFSVGGNGSGQGGALSPLSIFAASGSMPFISGIGQISNAIGKTPSGGNAYTLDTTNGGYLFQQNGAPATSEGLGAGGMGGRGGSVIPGVPSIGAGASVTGGNVGNSGAANTGAGGGGGFASTTAATSAFAGGSGGSGIVILNW
jgi:hypothetical protein